MLSNSFSTNSKFLAPSDLTLPFPRIKSKYEFLPLDNTSYIQHMSKLPTFEEMFGDLILENPIHHTNLQYSSPASSSSSSSSSDIIWANDDALVSPTFTTTPSQQKNKRPRRKFHEVQRYYTCNYPGCDKAFGALNHLNAHVKFKNHGPRRSPREFSWVRRSLFPSCT